MANANKVTLKLVIVGDPAVGKTCLLTVFKNGVFPQQYVPTVFENSVKDMTVGGQRVQLLLWDTAGQEDMDRVRVMSYNGSHIILLCYSVDSKDSFSNISAVWEKEVTHHSKNSVKILCGLKKDLRDTGKGIVTPEAAEDLRKKLKFQGYMEVSAKTRENVDSLFEAAVKGALEAQASSGKGKKKDCTVQ
eukprot:Clim_evm13s23 gene=Clim_evmTU13s23